jgi:hypothetical protein
VICLFAKWEGLRLAIPFQEQRDALLPRCIHLRITRTMYPEAPSPNSFENPVNRDFSRDYSVFAPLNTFSRLSAVNRGNAIVLSIRTRIVVLGGKSTSLPFRAMM